MGKINSRLIRLVLLNLLCLLTNAQDTQKIELEVESGHTAPVRSVSFSPNGKIIASAGDMAGTIILWSAATGRQLKTLQVSDFPVNSVTISPGWETVATASGNDIFPSDTISIWALESGALLKSFNKTTDIIYSIAFSPDGRKLVSGSFGNAVEIWDTETGRKAGAFTGHTSSVSAVTFSRDGKSVYSGSQDGTVRQWNVYSFREVRSFQSDQKAVRSLSLSDDGQMIAAGMGEQITIWRTDRGSIVRSIPGTFAAFAPDGKRLAIAGSNEIKLLDAVTFDEIRRISAPYVDLVAFSPDQQTLLGSGAAGMHIWDLSTGDEVRSLASHTSSLESIAVSPDLHYLAAGTYDGSVKLFDLSSNAGAKTLTVPYAPVGTLEFTPDSRFLYSTGKYGEAFKIWDVVTGVEIKSVKGSAVLHIAFSPNGAFMATSSYDRRIKIWDTASGNEIATLTDEKDLFFALAISPDTSIVASVTPGRITLWNRSTGTVMAKVDRSAVFVQAVSISPDNKTMAILNGSTLEFWDIANEKTLPTPSETPDWVAVKGKTLSSAVVGGKRYLASIQNGTISIYDYGRQRKLLSLVPLDADDWVAATPDGRFDTNRPLDRIVGLHWVVNNEILRPLPLDVFMRQYYEPGLVARLLECDRHETCAQEFNRLPSLGDLNRTQPTLAIK